ncbi:MAG: TerC family protein [Desulfotomaculales bacterium]
MEFVAALANIIVINLVLSGDNAVVIAMASRNLPRRQQKMAIFWGSAGAIALRVILTLGAVLLLKIPLLKAVGGILLVYIAGKLLKEDKSSSEACVTTAGSFWEAVKMIIVADLLMSTDNVLAIAGASKGNILLLAFGLALSIPIIIFGSQILLFFMKKFPLVIYLGAGILSWTAGEMIVTDERFAALFQAETGEIMNMAVPALLTAFIITFGYLHKRTRRKKAAQANQPGSKDR